MVVADLLPSNDLDLISLAFETEYEKRHLRLVMREVTELVMPVETDWLE